MTSAKLKVNSLEIAAALRGVTVTYDGYQTRALSRVDVGFRRGEVTAVLGTKSAGKSTLLKILSGRLSATEGSVKIFGRSARVVRGRIGYLPGKTDTNRAPGFVDRLLGKKREATSSARGVARLTQAILGNRDLVALDDPFVDLNAAEIVEAKALIRDLIARGKTVVLSSDSLMDIKDVCQQMVILHEGRVQAVGTLPELLSSASAIRFLPAILPNEIVERVLAVLRAEILSADHSGRAVAQSRTKTIIAEKPGAKSKASAAETPAKTKPNDSIDHEKLEGLVKPPQAD
jgi:ABC-type multidrug transport system ATPase subunit